MIDRVVLVNTVLLSFFGVGLLVSQERSPSPGKEKTCHGRKHHRPGQGERGPERARHHRELLASETEKGPRPYAVFHHKGVQGLVFSPDGTTIASWGSDGKIRIFRIPGVFPRPPMPPPPPPFMPRGMVYGPPPGMAPMAAPCPPPPPGFPPGTPEREMAQPGLTGYADE